MGAIDYFYKPFELDQLFRTIENALSFEEQQKAFQAEMGMPGGGSAMVEHSRRRAFQSFFVAVRSRRLFRKGARSLWLRLEAAEELYRKGGSEALPHRYDEVTRCLRSPGELQIEDPGDEIPFTEFYKMFAGIVEGRISLPQLLLAAFLRTHPPKDGRLAELRRQIWG